MELVNTFNMFINGRFTRRDSDGDIKMKKIIFFLIALILFQNISYSSSIKYNEYDRSGRKIGSYKVIGNTTIKYDKNGQKVGSYRIKSNGRIDYYNKYGQKEKYLR